MGADITDPPNPQTDKVRPVGIASLGLKIPSLYLELSDLAALRGVDPAKYEHGLGCHQMALCDRDEDVVGLAADAAQRALDAWRGDLADIGMIVVGSESAVDMSRPLSAFVADRLGLRGAVRSYEVKHACYGGTLALRQAVEWKRSGAAGDKAALVIAADVALYDLEDAGEPTQGAGAVAMVVDSADVAEVHLDSHCWSEPAFDFWRPVGESFPRVDGAFSLECYKTAAERCFSAWIGERGAQHVLDDLDAACFHVPFAKMVRKAVVHLGDHLGDAQDGLDAESFYADKVLPHMRWNQAIGNSYTASLWFSVAQALAGRQLGERLSAFSYGSGFGSELLQLTAGPGAQDAPWALQLENDLTTRRRVSPSAYLRLRGAAAAA